MKKYILSFITLFAAVSISQAATVTKSIPPAGSTNLVTGSCKVTQFVNTATTATNTLLAFVDSPTYTNFTYVIPAYTNNLRYATNQVYSYTNYWGAITTLTNLQLVTMAQSNAATTNTYPTRVSLAALASTSASLASVNYYFANGVQVTNMGSGTATATVTYQQ